VTGVSPNALASSWAVRWRPEASGSTRLFCVPHSGGGAATYRRWADWLAPDIEVVAVRLPGRETRFREPPYRSAHDAVPELLTAVKPLLDRPHAWFGHSMGALIAYEACRALDPRLVTRLVVAGRLRTWPMTGRRCTTRRPRSSWPACVG
jgi:medium-chain acyl-[acyl-carrier-protein] hydrolase